MASTTEPRLVARDLRAIRDLKVLDGRPAPLDGCHCKVCSFFRRDEYISTGRYSVPWRKKAEG